MYIIIKYIKSDHLILKNLSFFLENDQNISGNLKNQCFQIFKVGVIVIFSKQFSFILILNILVVIFI